MDKWTTNFHYYKVQIKILYTGEAQYRQKNSARLGIFGNIGRFGDIGTFGGIEAKIKFLLLKWKSRMRFK